MDELTRRGLIAAGASAAAAAGVAACAPAPSSPATGAGATGAPGAASPSVAASGATATGAIPAGVTVKAAEVPVGGGTILTQAKYVVTQPTAGTYKAFNKTCTHQACPVTKIVGSDIVCTCHNSKFSIVDGTVTSPPATKPLTAAKVTVNGDSLVITD